MKFEWELLHEEYVNINNATSTYRAKVLGGWLVLNRTFWEQSGTSMSESMIFITDPEYKWIITDY